MGIHAWATSIGSDHTQKADHLNLVFVKRPLVVLFRLWVEEAERHGLEGAYPVEGRKLDAFLAR
jgi:hypothetical protein